MSPSHATSESRVPSLLDITIDDIASGLDRGTFTCVNLVEAYLARVAEVNGDFRPVIEVNQDALAIARSLDAEIKSKGRRGPLHGVPIYLKDNIATLDQLDGSSGSLAISGSKPPRESRVAQKLRAAGAVILGKTNVSEWANMRSNNSSDGWSPRGGQTLGIYVPNQSPSGSSSGSAVATALGISLAAIGTETDGSLVCPAEKSSIVAIKPTVGLVSRDGIVPLSLRQDTAGPMARKVKDAARILSAISGRDSHDIFTGNIPFDKIPDYAAACSSTSLAGVRLGVPRKAFQVSVAVEEVFNSALRRLEQAGAVVVDNADFADLDGYIKLDPWLKDVVIMTDFKDSINQYLESLVINPNGIRDLDQLINYTKSTPGEEFPRFDVEVFETAAGTKGTADPEYKKALALEKYHAEAGGILGTLEKWNLDALLLPTCSSMALRFAAVRGFPIISLPLGFYPQGTEVEHESSSGLVDIAANIPFCLNIYGRPFSEETLIKIAYAHEQLNGIRDKPQPIKLPSTELKSE